MWFMKNIYTPFKGPKTITLEITLEKKKPRLNIAEFYRDILHNQTQVEMCVTHKNFEHFTWTIKLQTHTNAANDLQTTSLYGFQIQEPINHNSSTTNPCRHIQ